MVRGFVIALQHRLNTLIQTIILCADEINIFIQHIPIFQPCLPEWCWFFKTHFKNVNFFIFKYQILVFVTRELQCMSKLPCSAVAFALVTLKMVCDYGRKLLKLNQMLLVWYHADRFILYMIEKGDQMLHF